ncbi:MAG: hypothetical protein WAM44_21815, partial [Chthoniobacterales bacterium]
ALPRAAAPHPTTKKMSTAPRISIKTKGLTGCLLCYDVSTFQDVAHWFLGFNSARFLERELRRKPDWIW